ncbi:MAG: hydroxysqualene dehydroxylase HpnE [Gammaproteobacteria bacterium]|nr:hydroxysqualene dehydroxylase HpnE [Gammaproteobacteria bacterium]
MNVVVGGGWAGLAAAVELARHRLPVTLVEAAPELGGRARRVRQGERRGDNGQHLVIGAYRELLRLLDVLGVAEKSVFDRRSLELWMRAPAGEELRLRLPRLPAPLHLLAGLMTARGLSISEKVQALRLCLALRSFAPDVPDCSVADLLRRHGQSPKLVSRLWEPLCLATLNARVHEASAAIFRRVLIDAFTHRQADSDLLIACADLGAQLPDPAQRFIVEHGGRILTSTRAIRLLDRNARLAAVELADGTVLDADHAVLALPPPACERLLRPHPAMSEVAERLAAIGSAPICTVYLRYPPSVSLPLPLMGMLECTGQWICDLATTGRPGWMGVVISGSAHGDMTREQLIEQIGRELATLHPTWPAPLEGYVLRERRATFFATMGVDALRPGSATPWPNLHLAGDATATGYPATLEGAVCSGVAAARRVLDAASSSGSPPPA